MLRRSGHVTPFDSVGGIRLVGRSRTLDPYLSGGTHAYGQAVSEPEEMSTRAIRAVLARTLNDVAVRGHIVYVTSHGRRIAAVVPVPLAEQIEQMQAE